MHDSENILPLHTAFHKLLIGVIDQRVGIENKKEFYLSGLQYASELRHVVHLLVSRRVLTCKVFALKKTKVNIPVSIAVMYPEPAHQRREEGDSPDGLAAVEMFLNTETQMNEIWLYPIQVICQFFYIFHG